MTPRPVVCSFAALALCSLAAAPALARPEGDAPPAAPPPAAPPAGPVGESALGALRVGAYVEAFYQWNFNDPANGVTNYRGFDNRHNAITLANAALDASWQKGRVS